MLLWLRNLPVMEIGKQLPTRHLSAPHHDLFQIPTVFRLVSS